MKDTILVFGCDEHRPCPWCRIAELEADVARARWRRAELEAQRDRALAVLTGASGVMGWLVRVQHAIDILREEA